MSSRLSAVVTLRVPVDGGEPPRQYVPEVTVQVRVHYPALTPMPAVLEILDAAYAEVVEKLRASTTGT